MWKLRKKCLIIVGMSTHNPFLSIIIPTLNRERTILNCLNSIKNQTYNDFEVLVVDGKSSDNTVNIIKQFIKSDRRFKLIENTETKGVTPNNVSLGLSNAIGNYIGYVDSDDYIEPNYYEVLINNAKKYDADISQVQFRISSKEEQEKIIFYSKKEMRKVKNNIFYYTKTYSRCLRIHKAYLSKYILKYYTRYHDIMWEDSIFTFALVLNANTYVLSSLGLYNYKFERNNDFPKRIYDDDYFKRLESLYRINKQIFKDNPHIYSKQQYCVLITPIVESYIESGFKYLKMDYIEETIRKYKWRKGETSSIFLFAKIKMMLGINKK